MVINFAGGDCQCTGDTGCSLTSMTQTYTGNNTYTISKPQGFDGFSGGTITVNVPQPQLEEKNFSISDNGTTLIIPTSGKYISGGTITVNVPSPELEEVSYSITSNGTTLITPTSGKYISGGTITVNVPSQPYSGKTLANYIAGEVTELVPDDFGSATEVPPYCFAYSQLTSATIPNTVELINMNGFVNSSSLRNVTLNGEVFIRENAFSGCGNLSSVTNTQNIIGIEYGAFLSCSNLTGDFCINIAPKYNHTLFYNTFKDCRSLTSFTALNSVSKLYGGQWNGTFAGCTSMTYYDFTHNTMVPVIDGGAYCFSGISQECEIRVPQYLYDSWTAATNWSDASIVDHIVAYPNPSGYGEHQITYTTTATTQPTITVNGLKLVSHTFEAGSGGTITLYSGPIYIDSSYDGVNLENIVATSMVFPEQFRGRKETQGRMAMFPPSTLTLLCPIWDTFIMGDNNNPYNFKYGGAASNFGNLYVPAQYYNDYAAAIAAYPNCEFGRYTLVALSE